MVDQSFYEHPLVKQLKALQNDVNNREASLRSNERRVKSLESRVRQGLSRNNGPQDVKSNFTKTLPPWLSPGNIGELNKVIWPFWFTFSAPEMIPNSTATANFSVTQEAPFIWIAATKAVFINDGGDYTYINPDDSSGAGLAPGLSFSLRDAISTRQFTATPIDMDHIGNPRFPTVLPTPMMFLPNGVVEVQYFNNDPAVTYVPFLTFFGYRVRLEDANQILSTVTG